MNEFSLVVPKSDRPTVVLECQSKKVFLSELQTTQTILKVFVSRLGSKFPFHENNQVSEQKAQASQTILKVYFSQLCPEFPFDKKQRAIHAVLC